MPLVTSTEMFKKAYDGGYAIGAFNVNNMEIVQGITEACQEQKAPVILQVSKGARAYANHTYLIKMVEAAVIECPDIPIVLHLDHGPDFETCKACIDGGFTSVMIDCSSRPFDENVAETKKVVEYAHAHGVVVEAELGTLAGVEDDVQVSAEDSSYTHPEEVEEFVTRTGCDSLAIAIGTSHGAYKFTPEQCTRNEQGILVPPPLRFDVLEEVSKRLPGFRSFCTVLLPFRRRSLTRSTHMAARCRMLSVFRRMSSVTRRSCPSARSTSTPTSVWLSPPASVSTSTSIRITSIPVSTSSRPVRLSRTWSLISWSMFWAATARRKFASGMLPEAAA